MGKLEYAEDKYNLKDEDICDLKKGFVEGKKCYFNLHSACRSGIINYNFPEDAIIISDEIGNGVVPINADDRIYREKYGQLLQELASRSEHVIRIFCGIPEILK